MTFTAAAVFTPTDSADHIARSYAGQACTATYYRTDETGTALFEAEFADGLVILVGPFDLLIPDRAARCAFRDLAWPWTPAEMAPLGTRGRNPKAGRHTGDRDLDRRE
jgi:hypothetical protein